MVEAMLTFHVAQLMTNDIEQLIVCHHVNKCGIEDDYRMAYPYSECVEVTYLDK